MSDTTAPLQQRGRGRRTPNRGGSGGGPSTKAASSSARTAIRPTVRTAAGGRWTGHRHYRTQSQRRRRNVRRQRRKLRVKETINCCKHFLAFMFSNLGLSSLIVIYVIVGGVIFQRLELAEELRVKKVVSLLLDDTVRNVSGQLLAEAQQVFQTDPCLQQSLACLNFSQRQYSAAAELRFAAQIREYSRRLIKHLTDDGWNGRFDDGELNWSFSGALLYVVTVITTIGYGQVVPKTQGGYLLTMLYAFLGIPLTFLYLNNVGDYLADAFRLFYRDAFRPFWRRIFRKRTRQRAHMLVREWRRALTARIPISLTRSRLHRLAERLQAWTADTVLGDSDDRADETAAPDQPLLLSAATAVTPVGRPLIESKPPYLPSSAASIRVAFVVARVLPARGGAAGCPPWGDLASPPKALENGDCCHGEVNPLMEEVQTPISQKAIMDWTSDELQQVPLIDWDDIDRELEFAQEARTAQGTFGAVGGYGGSGRGFLGDLLADYDDPESGAADTSWGSGSRRLRRTRSAPLDVARPRCRAVSPPALTPPMSPSVASPTSQSPLLTTPSSPPPPPTPSQQLLPVPKTVARRPISLSLSALGADAAELLAAATGTDTGDGLGSIPMLRRCSYVSVHEPPTPTTPTIAEEEEEKDSMQGLSLRQVTVPLSLSVSVMILYIIFGALIFTIWEEDKNYVRWSYFCFITLSTIGFGDIVPGTKVDSENPKEKLVATVIYVAIGLSVFAMCFKLMQEEVIQKVRRFGRRIAAIRDRLSAGDGGSGAAAGVGGFARVNGLLGRFRSARNEV